MGKRSLRARFERGNAENCRSAETLETPDLLVENSDAISVRDCLEQVEICCEQARDASRCRRFQAAIGLFSTAVALCRRALSFAKIDDATRQVVRDKLERVSDEMAIYAQLAQSMKRPLHASSASSATSSAASSTARSNALSSTRSDEKRRS